MISMSKPASGGSSLKPGTPTISVYRTPRVFPDLSSTPQAVSLSTAFSAWRGDARQFGSSRISRRVNDLPTSPWKTVMMTSSHRAFSSAFLAAWTLDRSTSTLAFVGTTLRGGAMLRSVCPGFEESMVTIPATCALPTPLPAWDAARTAPGRSFRTTSSTSPTAPGMG